MLYIIGLVLLALLICATSFIGFSTTRLDSKITIEDANHKIGNTDV